MMDFDRLLQDTLNTLQALGTVRARIDAASDLVVATLRAGNKLLICGNGGSAAEAQHFATELVGRYLGNRRSLPAVALTSDGTLLTCIGNDFGWESTFARSIEGLARPGDLVVVFSTSGNSANIVAALRAAQRLGLSSLALLGKGGGACKGLATVEIIVPADRTGPVQEAHLFLLHHICERIEAVFPPPGSA